MTHRFDKLAQMQLSGPLRRVWREDLSRNLLTASSCHTQTSSLQKLSGLLVYRKEGQGKTRRISLPCSEGRISLEIGLRIARRSAA